MAKFGEMSLAARAGILFLAAAMVGAAYYYIYFNPRYQENQQLDARIKEKKAENETLKMFEPKLAEVNRNMAILQQQLEIQKRIVPEDKDADQFIKLLHDTAATSGIEIRRYTAMPTGNKEFYSEVPFAIDIDGPYYSVLKFLSAGSRAGEDRQRRQYANGQHQERQRGQGKGRVPLCSRRNSSGQLYGNNFLQPRTGSAAGSGAIQARTAGSPGAGGEAVKIL